MGQIPRGFIDHLLAQTDLVSVVSVRVSLKKQGKNHYACCPFHSEKSASFTVSHEKQFYYCFGCGVRGNAINFLMAIDHLTFPEAVEELAFMQGLSVPCESKSTGGGAGSAIPIRKALYQLLTQISANYRKILIASTDCSAYRYLKQRGLSDAVMERFAIGFAPNRWTHTLDRFGLDKEQRRLLQTAGLTVATQQERLYDRFRNRIIFPIRNIHGQVVAFGGRVIDKTQPKYLNSPETPLFNKGRILYGLYEACQTIPFPRQLLVVEGYMDVVSLAQFGVHYAVAALGTALTSEQVTQLFRHTDRVIFCYDGDQAGREAAWRALKTILPHLQDDRSVKFLFLPEGEDPDSLIRKLTPSAFEQLIEEAPSFATFLLTTLLQQVDLNSSEGAARLGALALPLIRLLPGEVLPAILRKQLAQKMGILDERQLEQLPSQQKQGQSTYQTPRLKQTPMRILMTLLIQNPALAEHVPPSFGLEGTAQWPELKLFNRLVAYCKTHLKLTTGQLLAHWQEESSYQLLEVLAIWEHMIEDAYIATTFVDTLHHVHTQLINQRLEQLITRDRIQRLDAEERREYALLLNMAKRGNNE